MDGAWRDGAATVAIQRQMRLRKGRRDIRYLVWYELAYGVEYHEWMRFEIPSELDDTAEYWCTRQDFCGRTDEIRCGGKAWTLPNCWINQGGLVKCE
jgi:hypothetical protein